MLTAKNRTIYLKEVKQKLDSVSESFCLAKWLQVTLHLQNGQNHSCHHVMTHKIDLDKIKNDPSALHNTDFKKTQRKLMLEGIRPNECNYCWKIEDTTSNYSDRTLKSASQWAIKYFDDVSKLKWEDNINPSYMEISFSNVCNFKCSYCGPKSSSQWVEEIQTMGQYPIQNYTQTWDIILNKDENPYVDAFWKYLPNTYRNLHTLRITGGEPLLSKDTFKLLDFIDNNPNSNLNFAINSNLNPPDQLFDNFIIKVSDLINKKKIKTFHIFTSAEGAGPALEYSRFGMNYNVWLSNLSKCFELIPNLSITIMSTYNIFSLTTYNEFLSDILKINQKFNDRPNKPLVLDIPYLRNPDFLSVFILDDDKIDLIKNNYEFMKKHSLDVKNGFYPNEHEKLERILTMVQNNDNKNREELQKRFIKFVNEYDRRRNTNFLKTFPELTNLYLQWSKL